MAKIKLSAPWEQLYQEIKVFFAEDDNVYVVFDEDVKDIKLFVTGIAKADALAQLLKPQYDFGSTKVNVIVHPANVEKTYFDDAQTYFDKALSGNGAFRFTRTVSLFGSNPMTFVVFAPEVVQYYTDNLGDWNGFRSTLYEDIAREIFKDFDSVYYCTDKVEHAKVGWL